MSTEMYPQATAHTAQRRRELAPELAPEIAPEIATAWEAFSSAVFAPRALDEKTKQLTAVEHTHG